MVTLYLFVRKLKLQFTVKMRIACLNIHLVERHNIILFYILGPKVLNLFLQISNLLDCDSFLMRLFFYSYPLQLLLFDWAAASFSHRELFLILAVFAFDLLSLLHTLTNCFWQKESFCYGDFLDPTYCVNGFHHQSLSHKSLFAGYIQCILYLLKTIFPNSHYPGIEPFSLIPADQDSLCHHMILSSWSKSCLAYLYCTTISSIFVGRIPYLLGPEIGHKFGQL